MECDNFNLDGYAYDVERAKRLLAEAGYPDGKGLSPLELWTSSKSETVRKEHAAIKRYLERLGLTVHLRMASSWKAYKRDIIGKRPGGIYRYAWHADFPDPYNFLYTLFHSASPGNYIHYANPEVDRLIDAARSEVDQQKRERLYHQAEALIMQDAPTVNIVYYEIERLFQPYVQGLDVRSMSESFTRMERIWLDR
ncbi:ABC transporter substrate-binding protein [Candidatus Entotheonella palauensis]|nr:ABC transporter substrate-binding protein [Candidatus Entotheonella palauensis]